MAGMRLGQCPSALNAGVNLLLTPNTTAMTQRAGMLALDGRCKTLSPAADGYARADACGVMLLLPAEVAGQQASLALVAGTAVNQDGRSSSLTAPNGPSQQDVVRAALRVAALPAAAVAALQMHGTGTPLGDPIEVGAAAAVLVDGVARQLPLALMAAKSWIGHAEPAAGVVGLAHAQAVLSQATALPILHLGPLNPYVEGAMEMGGGTWAAAREAAPLPGPALTPEPVAVGVSAFAFQGTNAHSVLLHSSQDSAGSSTPQRAWARQRFWVAVPPHAGKSTTPGRCMPTPSGPHLTLCPSLRAGLMHVIAPRGTQQATFSADLAAPTLAYLRDHTGVCLRACTR